MKKTSFTLLFALLLSMIGTKAWADDSCGDGVTWTLIDGTLTISKTGIGTGKMNNFEYKGQPWYSSRKSIRTIVINEGVTSIGDRAFYECTGLTSVIISNSVTSIGEWAFFDCSDLTSIIIPNSVTSIGSCSFSGCSGLTSITIPNSVTSIGNEAFAHCSILTSVTIPNSVTSIGDYTFYNCSGLTSVTIPNSVTSIGRGAFYECSGLTSVTIPNSVTSIGDYTFGFCSGLTSVTIPNSVTSIGDWAFQGCSRLTSIIIPNSVTSIGRWTFYECSGLTSISIPNSVMSIGEGAFNSCSGLTSITIPNSNIGKAPFAGCTEITELNLNCRTIGNWFYDSRSRIKTLTIGNNVQTIENGTFSYCDVLTSVTLNSNAIVSKSYYDGVLNLKSLKNIFGEQVSHYIIGNDVTSIGENAFAYCSSLTSIIIGNSVTSIGNDAFQNCSGLTSITIPNSVTSIGNDAFRYCSGLTSVTIGNSVTDIGGSVFFECTNLTSIVVESGNTKYDSRDNCNAIIETASNKLIYGCKNTIIPYGVTSIGDGALSDCKGLTSITIPNSVTSIGNYAFNGCFALTSITIGNSVTSIGEHAFDYCYDITSVTVLNPTPVTISKDVFTSQSQAKATLYVPKGSKTVYQAADYWKEFREIKNITHQLIYMVDGEEYKSYDVEEGESITLEAEPTKEGYTFSGWSDIPATMPNHDVTVTGTFTVNKYKLTYIVDGVEYKSYYVEYGATITPETEPTKDGYTFSGWSEIPAKMPAHDVTITGSFSKGQYKLIYVVDEKTYKTISYDYGVAITPEAEPTKEGHTFSGWSEIPAIMPAHDVTVTGSFSINKYKLTYKVDGEVYKTYDVEYGATITPEAEPTKDGYTFSGWSEIPATMPAHDVTVTGTFTQETGIEQIMGSENGKAMIFTIDGKRVDNLKKGLNVIRMKDGTIRKTVVK